MRMSSTAGQTLPRLWLTTDLGVDHMAKTQKQVTQQQSDQGASPHLRTWVKENMQVNEPLKTALARHIVTHHPPKLGTGLLMGSGTGNIILMSETIEDQLKAQASLDLAIVTNNMQVFYLMRDARQKFGAIFGDTQLSLTAGTLRPSLDSLVGRAAEEAMKNPQFFPDRVIFGAKNITFQGGLKLSYQFEDELGVQEALASRPTTMRILIADHTKFGARSTYQAKTQIEDLVREAHTCLVLTTVDKSAEAVLAGEEEALRRLLEKLAADEKFESKEFIFRVILEDGRVFHELTLSEVRADVRGIRTSAIPAKQDLPAVTDPSAGVAPSTSAIVNGRG
jgi:DeoR/GlpR family transcriptional regulator of sugar metabolism